MRRSLVRIQARPPGGRPARPGAGLLSVLVLVILVGWLATGCGGGSRRAATATGASTPIVAPAVTPGGPRTQPLLTIYEADTQLHADPPRYLDLLRSFGVDVVRVFMGWGEIRGLGSVAPDPGARHPPPGFDGANPAAYPAENWRVYDDIVRAARARGIAVDLTLGPPPPLWAQGPGDPGHPVHPQWRPSAAAYNAFVHAVGTRYSGHYVPAGASAALPRVTFWALWNEPNFGPMIAPQERRATKLEVSPGIYRRLLDAAFSALRATGHGADTILIGEIAPRGIDVGNNPGQFGYMVPLRFLRALYCVDGSLRPLRGGAAAERECPTTASGVKSFAQVHPALFQATGFSVHPYPIGSPRLPTPNEPDFADLPAIPKLERYLDVLTALYGHPRHYPIFNTEFGYETNPPERIFGSNTATVAAAYLNESEFISWRDPRIVTYDQYLLRDAANGEFATGLYYSDGRPKVTLAAWRLPLWIPAGNASAGSAREIWGCVRGAAYARLRSGRAQSVAIQFAPAGGAFRTIGTPVIRDPHGYFDVHLRLPGSGRVRLVWTPSGAPAVTSRTVAVNTT